MERESVARFIRKPRIDPHDFRTEVEFPYGLTVQEVRAAMEDVCEIINVINVSLVEANFERLEELMLGNTFSGFITGLLQFLPLAQV